MNGSFILDTNIVIAFFGNDENVVKEIADAGEIYLPVIAAGELFYGASNSGKPEKNCQKINEFLKEVNVLKRDHETGRFYGIVKMELKTKGRPIPENDIWIIALALQYQMPVVSRDKHFENIENLQLIRW